MERYLYVGPAIVAIIIFIHMRKQQRKRNLKLRNRLNKKNTDMLRSLQAEEHKNKK